MCHCVQAEVELNQAIRGQMNERSEEKFTSMSSAARNHTICQDSVARIKKKTAKQTQKAIKHNEILVQ